MSIAPRHLLYVATVARHRTISEAAAELGVSQPSVSIAVKHIEDLAGRPLFLRKPGAGIALTPFGRAFLKGAKAVLRESDQLDSLLRGGKGVRGDLIVDCFEDLAPYCLAPIIAALNAEHPDLHVSATELDIAGLVERIRLGVPDITISYDVGIPSDRHVAPLQTLDAYALLPPGDPLEQGGSISLAQLADRMLILSSRLESAEHFLGLFRLRGLPTPVYRMIRSFEMQRSMVANGLGCSISYTRPHGDMSYDGRPIRCLPIRDPLPPQRILAILPQAPARGSAEALLIDTAQAFFAARSITWKNA